MADAVRVFLKNKAEIDKKFAAMQNVPEKAMNSTLKRAKSSGLGWISKEVTAVYGLTQARVKKDGKATGTSFRDIAWEFTGSRLSVKEFHLTPKIRKGLGQKLSATIFKGQRKRLGPNAFIGKGLPWTRMPGGTRKQIAQLTTVSVPQMIENTDVESKIQKKLEEEIPKRLQHNLEYYMSKAIG